MKMNGREKIIKPNINTGNKIFGKHMRQYPPYVVVVQNKGKEMHKKMCCTCKFVLRSLKLDVFHTALPV